jgi:iron complex outermembrane recepter protein
MTKTLMLASVAAFALTGAPVFAQTATPAADDTPAEIVVTAQKRTERLQDVPVAVSVISGAALAAQGGVNLENAQYLVPSLTFRKGAVSINQSLFLRGVGTSTFSLAGEPSVSAVVDGVVYSRAGEAFSDLVDIERIEVLRGPQGTLFGKNASAGVVNIVTKQPTKDFEGSLEAAYFDRQEYRARGAVNIPVGELGGFRLTGFYSKYDGNIRNIGPVTDDYVNGYERYGVRGALALDLSPDVKLTIIGDWRKAKDDCCTEIAATTPNNAQAALIVQALSGVTFAGDKTRTIKTNLIAQALQTSWGVSTQLDATLGTQTVTSITAFRNFDESEIREGDLLPSAYVGLPQTHDVGPQTGKTFSQEIRLTSPGKEFVDYVIGAYYSHSDTKRTFTRNVTQCAAIVGATGLIPCGSANALPSTFQTGTAKFGSVFKNLAFFGQATINVSDNFRIIGGLRYTLDQLDVFHSRVSSPITGGPGIQPNFDQGIYNEYIRLISTGATPAAAQVGALLLGNGVPFRNKVTASNWSSKTGVQFDLSRDSTAYATFARGYKGPAFNVFFNLNVTGTPSIAPETSDAYEIGLKNTLFDGKLTLNLAAYYAKYSNFQANNPDVINVGGVPTIVARFTNAGAVSTRGAEVDLVFRPVRDLNIAGGFAYTDARVDAFKQVPGQASIPNGTTLAYAPKVKASLGGDYRWRTGGGVDLTFGAQGSYQSSQLSFFDTSAANRLAGTIHPYAIVDLSAGIVSADDRFRVTAQVKNLFDQSFASAIGGGGPGGSFRYIIPREADRYFGITAKVKFGN